MQGISGALLSSVSCFPPPSPTAPKAIPRPSSLPFSSSCGWEHSWSTSTPISWVLRCTRSITKGAVPKRQSARILHVPHQRRLLHHAVRGIVDPAHLQTCSCLRQLPLVHFMYAVSNIASIAFVGEMIPARKRKLALYPIILFYLFLSWFVLIV